MSEKVCKLRFCFASAPSTDETVLFRLALPCISFLPFCLRYFTYLFDYYPICCGSKWKQDFVCTRNHLKINIPLWKQISPFCFRLLPHSSAKSALFGAAEARKRINSMIFRYLPLLPFVLPPLASAVKHLIINPISRFSEATEAKQNCVYARVRESNMSRTPLQGRLLSRPRR